MKKSFRQTMSPRVKQTIRSRFDVTYSILRHTTGKKSGKASVVFAVKDHLYNELTSNGHKERVDLLWDEETGEGEFVAHPTDGYIMSDGGHCKKLILPYHEEFGLPLTDDSIECVVKKCVPGRLSFSLRVED